MAWSPGAVGLVALLVLPAHVALAPMLAPAAAVPDGPVEARQVVVRSFDGVALAATLFTPPGADASPPPFVLMTHGWAGSRIAENAGRVADLTSHGYGVLTWDSRGFGASGGEAQLDSPEFEVRDVQALLDWLAANAPVAMEAPGDPLVGMAGGSYAGAIQLLAAAHDPRIDAIAPEIAWNDLAQALAPNGVPKLRWMALLFGGGLAASCRQGAGADPAPTTGCQTADLARHYAAAVATNSLSDEAREALRVRSPATYIASIRVPTLLVQGFDDTLFDADQAVANYLGIKANGAAVKLWLHDGGHAGPGTQLARVPRVVRAWLDCHLSPKADCGSVGPEVEYYTPGVGWRAADAWPVPQQAGETRVPDAPSRLVAPAGGGAWTFEAAGPSGADRVATGGVSVSFHADLVGPEAILFASVGVRDGEGRVARVAGQAQPVRVSASGPVEIDLVDVSARVPAGSSLVVVLSGQEPEYNHARAAGTVALRDVVVTYRIA